MLADQPHRSGMRSPLGLALLVVGIVLLVLGISSADSFASDVSKFFTGSPTDKAVWMMVGGVASLIVGAVLLMRSRAVTSR
ncbi:MAG TPA: DUF3185 family protein [Planctomycetota bacterium]|nr:DUF3185 family protein [Planctomycetota bacterium]